MVKRIGHVYGDYEVGLLPLSTIAMLEERENSWVEVVGL